jgi:protein TonB
MNQWTTRQEAQIPPLQGWLSSIALHAVILLSVFSTFRQSLNAVHTEPFHWDVAFVRSAPTAHESVQTADTTKSDVPKQPERNSTAIHAKRTIQHAASSPAHITPLKPQTDAPAAPNSMPDSPSTGTSVSERTTPSIPNELSPPPAQTTEPLPRQTETTIDSATSAPPRLETINPAAPPEESTPIDSTHLPPEPPTKSDIAAGPAIRPDYGWLLQAISRRLEELKRSSHPSLDESRPLKVTVKAVVSREGILLDSSVVNSSGLDPIDQEAMALVQRAFPMQFDRTVDRQQIVMRIPITYSRE